MESNKTVSMMIEETKNSLVKVINTSGLPISIIKLIIENLSAQVNSVADTEIKRDIEKYHEAKKEEANATVAKEHIYEETKEV